MDRENILYFQVGRRSVDKVFKDWSDFCSQAMKNRKGNKQIAD
jgi:hypothetical protein